STKSLPTPDSSASKNPLSLMMSFRGALWDRAIKSEMREQDPQRAFPVAGEENRFGHRRIEGSVGHSEVEHGHQRAEASEFHGCGPEDVLTGDDTAVCDQGVH